MSDKKDKGYYHLSEAVLLGRESAARAKADYDEGLSAGVRLGGIPEFADLFPPGKPGQLISILAHSGHYKSTMANIMSMSRVRQIIKDGDTNKVVIFYSVEETVDRLALRLFAHYTGKSITDLSMGRFSHEVLEEIDGQVLAKLSGLPIILIAPPAEEQIDETTGEVVIRRSTTTGQNLRDIEEIFLHLVNEKGLKIDSIFIDYYQVLPSYDGSSLTGWEKNAQNVGWAIDMARSFSCVVILLAQVGLTSHNIKFFPLDRGSAYEGQVVGQRSDIVYTICNVTKLAKVGEVLEGFPGYPQIEVTPGLVLFTVAKSKISEELTVPLTIDPSTMNIKMDRQYWSSEAAFKRNHKEDKAVHGKWI